VLIYGCVCLVVVLSAGRLHFARCLSWRALSNLISVLACCSRTLTVRHFSNLCSLLCTAFPAVVAKPLWSTVCECSRGSICMA
jgi:hypothetical protein